jgi:cell division protein FtsB
MPSRSQSRSRRPARRSRRRPPLARWLAVGTLAVVALLYYRPLKSYFEMRSALEHRAAEVQSLRTERRVLARRLAGSDTPEALARRARRLGLVKPGERLFIVKGIDEWRARHGQTGTGTSIGSDG